MSHHDAPAHDERIDRPGRKHVVVLVHGIRTFAFWQGVIKQTLTDAGFVVECINYEYFDVVQFLLPVPWFSGRAVRATEEQLRQVFMLHKDADVSLLCHSFGTYVFSRVMKKNADIHVHRVIFCGSVVRPRFRFEDLSKRFTAPILNDIGTRDFWPVLAESSTWGYGSTGTFGFRRPFVSDRTHNGLAHGDFLNAEFCRRFWVPYLRSGEEVRGDTRKDWPPFWIWLLAVFKIRNLVLLAAIVALLVFRLRVAQNTYQVGNVPPAFPGSTIASMVSDIDAESRTCYRNIAYDWIRGRRCVSVSAADSQEASRLAFCREFTGSFRDPLDGLKSVAAASNGCLVVNEGSDRTVEVTVNVQRTETWLSPTNEKWLVCGCQGESKQQLAGRGWRQSTP
jgi:hypothetical protein